MNKFLLTIGLCLMGLGASAQYYHTAYGHNRIQYKRFEWYYYSTNNFEVYYYPGGKEYAEEALKYLEEQFTELTDILGYAPYTKTKIFIYNSIHDLQQSNIGIGGEVYTIGGKTDFVKLQVEIAYPGQSYLFKQELTYHLGQILINDMMFGGSLAEIFQNAYLLSLPTWFIDGAAKYLAEGWTQDMDDFVRDYLSRKKLRKLVKIENENPELLGQSIWNYIALKYGKSNISNILNLTRIIRNEENSISSTLGIPFKQFLKEWQAYYVGLDDEISQNYVELDPDLITAGSNSQDVQISHVKINPEGSKLAYTYHRDGRYEVIVKDINTGKKNRVVKGGYLINDQKIEYQIPLIDWQNNQELGVLLYKRGYLYLNTYNVKTGERFQKPLQRFREVESFSFNDNGKLAIISGDVDGQNDLFLISMKRNALKRITNDQYDDLDPTFIPGTSAIVFSSNRVNDSVRTKVDDLKSLRNNFNLFVYDLDTTTVKFRRLTNTLSVDRKPFLRNQNELFYLSDQMGISNLYTYNLIDSTFSQMTNYDHNLADFDMSSSGQVLVGITLRKGNKRVFVEPNFNIKQRIFTPSTPRQRLVQARYISQKASLKQEKEPEERLPVIPEKEIQSDTLIIPDDFKFSDEIERDTIAQDSLVNKSEPVAQDDENFIDTDNYVFQDDVKEAFRPESFFSSYRKFERKSKVVGPDAYLPRFNFSNLITSFGIDPIRGFSMILETEISDILENHRLTGGVMASTDFKSGNIYAEYQYLKYWMDFRLRYNRNTYIIQGGSETGLVQKYFFNELELSAAIPLTNSFRFEFSPMYANTQFNNLHNQYVIGNNQNNLFAEDNTVHYGGFKAAAIVDNTLEKGFNIFQGTKALVEFQAYQGLNSAKHSFTRINADIRHYQKIHKELTFATRLFYGRSMGPNAQNYLLGGMQNWLFNEFSDQGVEDPLKFYNNQDNSNLMFTTFVTNLRGFNYNEMFGQNAMVFNAELRFPVFEYFSNTPITSAFLRNFQLIGFYDLGTAWTGKAPFNGENSAFTKKYAQAGSPFSAEIANFQNPWLSSYGAGLRTVLMGYYLKIDVAKPIQDRQVGSTRFYFTLGLDF